jgi:hypothetical protein
MNKFSDDIREYDPLLWIKLKKTSPKVKVSKEIKKEIPIELTKHYNKPDIKIKSEIVISVKERRQLKNKENYNAYGKQWYEDNKERLKELRKSRITTEDSKDNKYFYNRQYYETNREELNKKRRIKDKERRDQKKLLS